MIDLQQTLSDHAKWLAGSAEGQRASLTNADLTNADLSFAVLRGANLTGANLTGANLRGAALTNAVLTGAELPDGVPLVTNIDAAILSAISEDASGLKMDRWHCGTTHCRAGWAVILAGDAGVALERQIGTAAAGALIYAASRPDKPVPNFYASNADALADLRESAAS